MKSTSELSNKKLEPESEAKCSNNFIELNRVVLKPVSGSDSSKCPAKLSNSNNETNDKSDSILTDRESIIDCSKVIENMLVDLMLIIGGNQKTTDQPDPSSISPSRHLNQMKRICDKVLLFRKSCLSYAEHSLLPQQRFRFRELLTKLEKSNESLRATNNDQRMQNSSHQFSQNVQELKTNIRDIVTFIQK